MKLSSILLLSLTGSVDVEGHYVRTHDSKMKATRSHATKPRSNAHARSPRASSFDYDTLARASSFDYETTPRESSSLDYLDRLPPQEPTPPLTRERESSSLDWLDNLPPQESTPPLTRASPSNWLESRAGAEAAVATIDPTKHKSTYNDLPEVCHSLEKGMAYIENHAWDEDKFSDQDYQAAKPFLELVTEEIYSHIPEDEANKIIGKHGNLDEFVLGEIFTQIDKDPSERDKDDDDDEEHRHRRILSVWDSLEEYETAVATVHYYLSIFPHEEMGKIARMLEKLDMRHLYHNYTLEAMEEFLKENGVPMVEDLLEDNDGRYLAENQEKGLEAFLQERGLRMLLTQERKSASCINNTLGLIAALIGISMAVLGLGSVAAKKVGEKLCRKVFEKVGWKVIKKIIPGIKKDISPSGAVKLLKEFLLKPLSVKIISNAVRSAMSDWWTWISTVASLSAKITACFATAGASVAVQLVGMFLGIAGTVLQMARIINICTADNDG